MPKGKYTRNEEHKKNSIKNLGFFSLGARGEKNSFFGKRHSEQSKKKMSNSHKGNPSRRGLPHSIETKKKISFSHKGKKIPSISGKNHPQWRGGVSTINNIIRHSIEYKLWRESVFVRDNYTCVFCGQKGGELQADHIKPFSLFPELRFAIDNGRTLCIDCHKKTDTWGRKAFKYK